MRMLKTIAPALIALLVLVTGAQAVAAQGVAAPSDPEMDLDGLEKAYNRIFSADMMAMIDPENPEAQPTGWFMLTMIVLDFDSEDTAETGFNRMIEETESSAAGEGVELEDVELDLDMEYIAKQAVEEAEGVTSNVVMVTARDGEYVYIVSGITFGDDPIDVAASTIEGMQDADVSDDEEMFHDDGTSMGGLWAKFPTAADMQGQVESLTQVSDTIIHPIQAGTPAA